MAKLKNNILNNNIAGDTSNILIPDSSAIKNGIAFKSNIDSNVLNGFYNILSNAIQYLQFTGGLYSKEADYNEGNIASLVIKTSENYSIWQFRRNSNNPQVLNNNHPITGGSITTVNGIDIYEGGTLNTDWDKLTENYDIEAVPNTVMIRDEVGASNVNTPSNIKNTTVINNEYLQTELAKKQNNLIAGTNVEITEDNIINVKGDVATDANLVTQTNEALGENVQTAIDILNKRYMLPCYYEQLTDDNGNFLENEEPANWYQALYGVTTVWELVHNTKSAVFRTEGIKSNVSRINGLQPYGMPNLSGHFIGGDTSIGVFTESSGVFQSSNNISSKYKIYMGSFRSDIVYPFPYTNVDISTNKQIKEYTNDLVMDNLLVRKYKLISINGISIKDFLNEIKTKQKLLNDILNSKNIKRKGV